MAPLVGNGLLPLPSNINASQYGDWTLLTVIHKNVPVQYAAVYRIYIDGSVSFIGRSEAFGKDDSAASVAFPNGLVRLFVSEADPGQSGTTSKVHYYDFVNGLPSDWTLRNVDQVARQDVSYVNSKLNATKLKLSEAGN